MPLEDRDLIAAHRAGDLEAFAQLYDRYVRRIYDFVYFKTHHRQTAEDITSQTFLKALERLHQYRESKGAFSAWLHRIARNTVFDYYRAKRPLHSIDDAWDLPSSDDTLSSADAALRLEEIRAYLQELQPRQRDLIVLRLWNGYSFAEIGEMLDMSEGACKVAFHRALGTMRSRIAALILFFSLPW